MSGRDEAERTVEEAYVQGYDMGWRAALESVRRDVEDAVRGHKPESLIRNVEWPNSPIATSHDYAEWLDNIPTDSLPSSPTETP